MNHPSTGSTQTARTRHLTSLFAGAFAISFAPILFRWSDVGPSTTAGFRLLFAMPLLWIWMQLDLKVRDGAAKRPSSRRDFVELATAGLFFIGDLAVWHWSMKYTSVANSTLLTNGAPIFVTIGAWYLFGERISSGFLFGLALALAGAVVLLSASLQLSRAHLWGDILAIIGAVFYGAYQLMVKHLRLRFSTPVIMNWVGFVACPGFFLVGALSSEKMVPGSPHVWAALIGMALICHVAGQTLIAYSFGHLPASFSSLTLLLQPVVAALLAWSLLGENLVWNQIAGGLITLAGIGLASRNLAPTPNANEEPSH